MPDQSVFLMPLSMYCRTKKDFMPSGKTFFRTLPVQPRVKPPVTSTLSTTSPADSSSSRAFFLPKNRRWVLSRIPHSSYFQSPFSTSGTSTLLLPILGRLAIKAPRASAAPANAASLSRVHQMFQYIEAKDEVQRRFFYGQFQLFDIAFIDGIQFCPGLGCCRREELYPPVQVHDFSSFSQRTVVPAPHPTSRTRSTFSGMSERISFRRFPW